jgi:hypothetical protein
MKKTRDNREAKAASGAEPDTGTVRSDMEAQARHDACQRLRAFLGTEPDAQDVPRRRERPLTKRRAACSVWDRS